jgi:hypothetical protein
MRRGPVWLCSLAFSFLLVGGCVDDTVTTAVAPTSEDQAPPLIEDTGEPIDSGSGGISGVVVDDELRPLLEANVTLDRDGKATVTDATGQFLFPRLEGGEYLVTASKDGFTPLTRKVSVEAGVLSFANFTLTPLASTAPYVESYSKMLYIEFGQGLLDQTVLRPVNRTCQCKVPMVFPETTRQVLLEVFFQPAQDWPNNDERVYHSIFRNAPSSLTNELVSSGYLYSRGNVTLNPPDRIKPGENRMTWYLGGDHPFPMVSQRVELFISVGHHGPLPGAWTALPPA